MKLRIGTLLLLVLLSLHLLGEEITTKKIKCVSHRGEAALAPEGSLAAYRLGAKHHAEIMKLDIRRTSDDVIVLSHDWGLNRTCPLASQPLFSRKSKPKVYGLPYG